MYSFDKRTKYVHNVMCIMLTKLKVKNKITISNAIYGQNLVYK